MNSKERQSADKQFVRMTQTPVNRLIVTLAVPTVISMLITTIYNVADTYFVSTISVAASGATGVVFALMGIIQAVGFTLGAGSGSIISRLLGAKDVETARRYCSTAFFLAVILGAVITALGIVFIQPIMIVFGSTQTILPYACTYGLFILIAAPGMITSCVMNNILRYEGMARLAMIGLAAGGILNIVLDPLFIYGFDMGIAGAGIATAVSQYVSMLLLLSVFLLKKSQTVISFKYIDFRPKSVWNIISTGLPSFARQGLNSVSAMVLNVSAAVYGDECIAAMSIVSKVAFLIFSVCVGIGQGFQPVAGFNYGSKLYVRVRQGILFLWRFGTAVVAVLSATAFFFAPHIIALFRDEKLIIEIGTDALRFLCISLLFLPTVVTANMTFQSIGKKGRALLLACCQNGLFFIPLALILPHFIELRGIELAQPIGYVLSAVVSVPFTVSFLKWLKSAQMKNTD